MAEVRISELTAHSTGVLAATDLIEVSQDLGAGIFGSRKLTGLQLRNGIKTYKANLTQTGTSAPTATVFINTLSGTPTFSYVGVGSYELTLTAEFTNNKTYVIMNTGGKNGFARAWRVDVDKIRVETYTTLFVASNDILDQVSLIIEVHP
jgi:hypothetical protein